MVGGLWPLLIWKLRGIENSAGNQKKHIKRKHIYTLGLHVFIKIIRGVLFPQDRFDEKKKRRDDVFPHV